MDGGCYKAHPFFLLFYFLISDWFMAKRKEGTLPHSVEAEEGVLGSVLLGGSISATTTLVPAMFYMREHQLIWEAVCFLVVEKKPVDIVTIKTFLVDRSLLEQAGGQAKLVSLTEGVFSVHNIEQYAKTVRSKWMRRQLIASGTRIASMGEDEDQPIEELVEGAESETKKLVSFLPKTSSLSLSDGMDLYQEELVLYEGKKLFWWSWGDNLSWLDDATRGIRRKKVYRIGAMSWAGKTQLGVYNLIPNLLRQGAKVMFFPLENDIATTINNILANMQGVNNDDLIDWTVKADLDLLFPYRESLSIIEGITDLGQIMKTVEREKPDIVILDYIGYVTMKGVASDKVFAEYAKAVVPFTKEQDISWIDLSNLKMGNEENPMATVYSGQFFGASELKNNIDLGIHIINNEDFRKFREEMVKEDWEHAAERIPYKAVDVWITKNRGGRIEMSYRTYIYDWAKGGRMREATKAEKQKWKDGYLFMNENEGRAIISKPF